MIQHPSSRKPLLILLASIAALATTTLQAQTSWLGDGANGNWSDPLNWSANAPGPTNRTVVFGNAFTGSPTGGNLVASNNDLVGFNGLSLTFENTPALPSFTVSGNGFTLSASGITAPTLFNNSPSLQTFNLTGALNFSGGAAGYGEINAANGDLVFSAGTTINGTADLRLVAAAGRSITVNGPVGGVGLLKSGPGTLTLGGTNTYTGGTVISQGTLVVTNQDSLGNGTLTLGDANTGANEAKLMFQVSSANTTFTNLNVAAAGTGPAKVVFNQDWWGSPGTTYLSANDLRFTLNRRVNIQSLVATKQISPFITGPGAGAGEISVHIDGGTTVILTSSLSAAETVKNDFSGNVWITGNTRFDNQNRSYITAANVNGVVPDQATVIIDAGSTFRTVWGAESVGFFSGEGIIQAGVTTPNSPISIVGSAANPTTSPTTLGFASFAGTMVTMNGGLTKSGSGTQELKGAGITYAAATNLDDGALRLTNTTGFGSNVALGATLSPVLQINAPGSGDSWTFNRSITGGSATARLEKIGAGTVTVSATETFTGSTEVVAGTLNLTGTLTNSALTVDGGATLTGTGHVGGLLSIQSGGLLSPGASGGTLFADAALTLASGSNLRFDLTGTNISIGAGLNDTVAVLGALTLDGSLTVNELVAGSFASATLGTKWQLFSYTGALTDNGLDFGTMPTLAAGRSFAVDLATPGQVNLAVVPEPGSGLALLGGLGMLAGLRRRR